MASASFPTTESALKRRFLITHELVLASVLVIEIAVFSAIGKNFLTWQNAFEVTRLLVEVGLLAVAMTPVIVTGGIDLSVGSLMGLSAVLFGMMWDEQHAHLPMAVAVAGTLAVGAAAGSLNALLITRLRLPPLIVTLGTYSLFRGLGEGMTRGGTVSFNIPESFQFLGQGYLAGGIPTQLPLFIAVVIGFWILLQRTTIGRALYAIGFSPNGARHAGIPVARRLALVYILSGLAASFAAVIYVSHIGQAKCDAGTGYELTAITAVVLGGTSIFGGRGTIQGTVLGILAITVLQNGLQLAALPGYLAGILMGGLLLVTISMERLAARSRSRSTTAEEFEVRNSQVAVLSFVILVAALIVAGSNWFLLRDIRSANPPQPEHTTSTDNAGAQTSNNDAAQILASVLKLAQHGGPVQAGGNESSHPVASELTTQPDAKANQSVPRGSNDKITIAMMPKSLGNAYFIACRKGAQEAAKELNVDLIWDGPTDPDPARQSQLVDSWITRQVDVIAVAVENADAISSVLKKARARGIKVLTWDADSAVDARDFFVNQATPQGIGYTLMDDAARLMNGKGEFAVIVGSLTAGNMIQWQKYIRERLADKYPDIKLVDTRACDDLQSKAFEEANTFINAYPNLRLIMAICSPGVPGAAEAVKQSGRSDVKVIGLGLPNDNKPYVHEGVTDSIVLWNTMDLGYLTVYAADALARGKLNPGDKSLTAGRLKTIEIEGDNVLLGKPYTFTKDNIDQFDF